MFLLPVLCLLSVTAALPFPDELPAEIIIEPEGSQDNEIVIVLENSGEKIVIETPEDTKKDFNDEKDKSWASKESEERLDLEDSKKDEKDKSWEFKEPKEILEEKEPEHSKEWETDKKPFDSKEWQEEKRPKDSKEWNDKSGEWSEEKKPKDSKEWKDEKKPKDSKEWEDSKEDKWDEKDKESRESDEKLEPQIVIVELDPPGAMRPSWGLWSWISNLLSGWRPGGKTGYEQEPILIVQVESDEIVGL